MATSPKINTFDRPKLTEKAEDFLRDYYRDEAADIAVNGGDALYVEFGDLYQSDSAFADDYLALPEELNEIFVEALDNLDLPADHDFSDTSVRMTDEQEYLERLGVGELQAHHLGQFVAVEGQLSKVTGLGYRIEEAAWQCQRCGTFTYLTQPRGTIQEPTECQGCERQGPYEIHIGQSTIRNQRKMKLTSPPENRLHGEGDSVIAYAERDLCHIGGEHGLADRAGERVVILGKLAGETGSMKKNDDPEVDAHLRAESVIFVEQRLDDINIAETKEEFQRLADGEEGDPIELLKDSISPRIERTEQIDRIIEASVGWLFNGFRIDGDGGDQIRGDLHMAVIGDPSTGKSSIFAELARIAPKSVFRSGGSISKVGLTAAAQQEEFDGKSEWTLEPGILPRANGGHCLIDEVDEVLDERSKAIHDALENEQMVKVDKAGISADLPTRTAVLIGGNPKEGRFDPYASIPEQLDMDPALISRMDILLPLTDKLDRDIDERIADKVLDSYQELAEKEVADRMGTEPPEPDEVDPPVPVEVFRDWVHYARENCFPTLTDQASSMLKEMYLDVRNINDGYESQSDDEVIPATSRALMAGVRLSTAYARVELNETVEAHHVRRTESIIKASIGLNFDADTGQFDADGVQTKAKPKSQRQRIDAIKDIAQDLRGDYDAGIPEEDLIDAAVDEGIDESKAEHEIERMRKRSNELYSPPGGGLLPTKD